MSAESGVPAKGRAAWRSRKLWLAVVSLACAMVARHCAWIDGGQLVMWATSTVLYYMGGNVGTSAVDAIKAVASALQARGPGGA
ncbi:MAG: hypothetical protein LW854_08565 [Rubrivivax sp.]|jgi:hypothetical protein|nr:hypothetical protein [Rubrivivax sp.]